MNRIAAALTLALLSTAVAVGCGGSDDETSSTPAPASTKQELVQQADQICEEGDKPIDQAAQETFSSGRPSPEQMEQFANTLIPAVQGQIDKLGGLTPPAEEEQQFSKFLDTAQQELDAVEEDPSKLSEKSFSEAESQAKQLGFQRCAQ